MALNRRSIASYVTEMKSYRRPKLSQAMVLSFFLSVIFMFEYFFSYLSLGVSFAKLLKFVSHIARYAPFSFATIYLKDTPLRF